MGGGKVCSFIEGYRGRTIRSGSASHRRVQMSSFNQQLITQAAAASSLRPPCSDGSFLLCMQASSQVDSA